MIRRSKDLKSIYKTWKPSEQTASLYTSTENQNGQMACHATTTGTWADFLNDQTTVQMPHFMIFPITSQGTTKSNRLSDKIRMTFFNNKHTLEVLWPGYDNYDTTGSTQATVAAEMAELNAVRMYIYECSVQCNNESMIKDVGNGYVYNGASQTATMGSLITRFQIWIANQPTDSFSQPTNVTSEGYVAYDGERMWGTKQNKSEIETDVLNVRASAYSQGIKILKVHKLRPPRRRMYSIQDNNAGTTPANVYYSFNTKKRYVRAGRTGKMNKTFYYKDDATTIPRNGICYFQVCFISNPENAHAELLPWIKFRNGNFRMSWTD